MAVRKMPSAPKTKGKLHPHHVADKKAARTKPSSKGTHPMPHGLKTPDAMMPNQNMGHQEKRVAKGSHTNAGGTGFEQDGPKMMMRRKTTMAKKKR